MKEKPARESFVSEIEKLRSDGSLDKVYSWIDSQKPVWIRRTNGVWQKCIVHEVGYGGLACSVTWTEPGNPKPFAKVVDVVDLLRWQEEAVSENVDQTSK